MSKKLTGGIIGLVIVVGIIALKFGAGMGIGFLGAKAGAPEVGDCVVLTGGSESADVDTKKCGTSTLWKVASDDGKCDEMETNYFVEVTGAKAVNLCLAYDVTVGECIEVAEDMNTVDKNVACTAEPATAEAFIFKVTKIDTKSADLECAEDEFPLPNVTRKTSLCAGDPAA